MATTASPINSASQLISTQLQIAAYCCKKMIPLIAKCLELNGIRVHGEKPNLQLFVTEKKVNKIEYENLISQIQAYSDACQIAGLSSPKLAVQKTIDFALQNVSSSRLSSFIEVMREIDTMLLTELAKEHAKELSC